MYNWEANRTEESIVSQHEMSIERSTINSCLARGVQGWASDDMLIQNGQIEWGHEWIIVRD